MTKTSTKRLSAIIKLAAIAAFAGLAAFVLIYLFMAKGRSGSIVNANCEIGIACVYLKTNHAEPDATIVKVGEYVQFSSADGKTHNLGLGMGDAQHDGSHDHKGNYVSGDFKSDESWKVQFKKTGTYELHDHYRPDIRVTVVVYDPDDSYKIK